MKWLRMESNSEMMFSKKRSYVNGTIVIQGDQLKEEHARRVIAGLMAVERTTSPPHSY